MCRMDEGPNPSPTERAPLWRRAWARVQQLRKPLLVVAGVGAVLGGLAGYWNAYRAVQDVSGVAAAPAAPAAGERTLAVLAFAHLGEDKSDAVFAEGVGEELVHVLSRIRGLRVTARRSALQFKDKALPMAEMARQLQVNYLVDGTVRRTGERVRIGAQLVDGGSGAVLWSGQFERDLKDAMAAQSELALQIAQQLKLPLDAATLEGSGTKNVQAWQLFMQAERLPRGTGQREPLYRQALALDPAFSRVHVELAEEELNKPWAGRDGPAVGAKIVAHLEAALRIDPRSAFAHGRLATAAALRNDLQAMRHHAHKALELDPGDMPGLNWSSELELAEVRVGNAIALRRQMVEVEPLDALARLFLAQRLRWT